MNINVFGWLICHFLIFPQTADADSGAVKNCLDNSCKYCKDGWYGIQCNYTCPINCDSGCDRTSGQCDHQCKLNYTGKFCEQPCPPNCREGCNQTTAMCHGGCYPRFHGMFCNMSCGVDCYVCYRLNGKCIASLTTPLTTTSPKDVGRGEASKKSSFSSIFLMLLVLVSSLSC